MPIHVFLDTNILSASPRRNTAAFHVLERLGRSGELLVHLSEVTVREFVSQEDSHFEAAIAAARKALNDTKRRGLNADSSQAVADAETAVTRLESTLRGMADESLRQWVRELHARVHPPQGEHGAAVLNSYFTGSPPFQKKKSRTDIPDAFIFESLRLVLSSSAPLHAVIADTNLRKCVSGLADVTAYETLDQLVQAPDVQRLVARNANIEQNLQLVRRTLAAGHTRLDATIREQAVAALADKQVESRKIPDDTSTATILSVGDARAIVYGMDEANYYGEGLVVVPLEFEAEVLTYYSIYKGDWASLPDRRAERISISDRNDHYFDVEESFVIRAQGTLNVQFDPTVLEDSVLDQTGLTTALAQADLELEDAEATDILEP